MITAQGKQYKANEITKKMVGAITASGYPALNSCGPNCSSEYGPLHLWPIDDSSIN